MALFHSLSLLTLPLVVLFSLPLALLASLTAVAAFTILFLRVLVVYAELAVAVIPHYLLRQSSRTGATRGLSHAEHYKSLPASTLLNPTSPARRHSRRRESTSSSTPSILNTLNSSNLTLPIPPPLPVQESIGAQRDFEGVGGWRLDQPSDDDYLWTNMNSRLELPAEHVRRHRRSLTSSSNPLESHTRERSYSPEMKMMSPNTSRARTPRTPHTPPNGLAGDSSINAGTGYFVPFVPTSSAGTWSPKHVKKASSQTTLGSGSSESSKGSAGGLSMNNIRISG